MSLCTVHKMCLEIPCKCQSNYFLYSNFLPILILSMQFQLYYSYFFKNWSLEILYLSSLMCCTKTFIREDIRKLCLHQLSRYNFLMKRYMKNWHNIYKINKNIEIFYKFYSWCEWIDMWKAWLKMKSDVLCLCIWTLMESRCFGRNRFCYDGDSKTRFWRIKSLF